MECKQILPTLVFGLFLWAFVGCNRVLELSDRFLEVRHNGMWFVKFYAPWCGHCKSLEPVWSQVAQLLVDTDIRVSRLDCTRFTSVATEFGVRGFPTILFIKGHKVTEYKGDRTREDLVDFARRMSGPPVRHLSNCADLQHVREHQRVFFVYTDGDQTSSNVDMMDNYTYVAQEFQPLVYFYTVPYKCLSVIEGISPTTVPAVYVFKDNTTFKFQGDNETPLNESLYDWINKERFPAFIKITNGNFYQLMRTKKHIVMAVLEENQIGQLTLKMQEFRDLLEAIALTNRDLYHEQFIFGWLGSPDIANSVAMTTLPVPSLIVVHSETYQYYLPQLEEDEKVPLPQTVLILLDQISSKKAQPLGGDSWFYRMYRAYYEAKTSISGMWRGNPVLTAVLFGLPLGFLSIICYTSCCSDILDASDEEEDQGYQHHPKRE